MVFPFMKSSSKAAISIPMPSEPSMLVGAATRLEEHANTVFCCTFGQVESSRGSVLDLATASYDGTVRVWEVEKALTTKKPKSYKVLKGAKGGVWCCAYAPDASLLVAGCSKGQLAIYDPASNYDMVGKVDKTHGTHACFCTAMGSPTLLATGGGDKKLKLWDISPGTLSAPDFRAEFTGHTGDVVCCAFNPMSGGIISGSEDKHVRVWDVETQECIQTLIGHTAEVCGCAFDTQTCLMATGSSDMTIKIWDPRQRHRCVETLHGHTASIYSCRFNSGGAYPLLGSTSQDGSVAVWDPRTWGCCQVTRQHAGEVIGLAFDPSGRYVCTGSADMTCNLALVRKTAPDSSDVARGFGSTAPIPAATSKPSGTRASARQEGAPPVLEVGDAGMSPEISYSSPAHRAESNGGHMLLSTSMKSDPFVYTPMMRPGTSPKITSLDEEFPSFPASPSEEAENLRRDLLAFYASNAPHKMANVHKIVSEFVKRGGGGQEIESLNSDLTKAYGHSLLTFVPPPVQPLHFLPEGSPEAIQEPVFEDTLPPTYETVVPQTSQAVVPDTDQTSQAVVPENSTFDAGVPQNSTFPAEDVDPPIHDVVPEMDGEVVPETALDTSVPSPPSRFNGGGWEGVADLGRFEDKTGGGNFEGKMGGENFEGKTGGEDLEGKTGGGELEGEMGDEHEDPMAAFLSSMGRATDEVGSLALESGTDVPIISGLQDLDFDD